jgi:hypothetical protein
MQAKLPAFECTNTPRIATPISGRSDNQSLADLGIPAHTLGVAFEFPDYHKVSDSWDKIDYENMIAVDRAVALGLLRLTSDEAPPKWNEQYGPARHTSRAAGCIPRQISYRLWQNGRQYGHDCTHVCN